MGRVSDAKQRLLEAVMELICSGSYGTTTVDLICEKAGVKKGSFYHFFHSKSELAIAALESQFQEDRKELDAIFSPTVPPIERLLKMCRNAVQWQEELKRKYGRVLGCPLHCLGAEVSTQEPELCAKIQEICTHYKNYMESAIREAHAKGLIRGADPAAKAQMFFAYYEGLMTQARIQNDLRVMDELEEGILSLLGVKATRKAAA